MSRWVLVGAGFTGSAVARRLLARGDEVVVTKRDAAAARALGETLGARGIGLVLDAAAPVDFAAIVAIGGAAEIVASFAPPGADPAGEARALVELARALGAKRIVYVSSTGVYAPGGGAWVDEDWPREPATASGRARLAAEDALRDAATAIDVVVLRAAGIYGPGRGLAERIQSGAFRVVGDGRAHVSRIHVEDLASAVVAAGDAELRGFLALNIADDDPAPLGEVADAIAARLGLPPPARVPIEEVSKETAGMLAADRRIANARAKRVLGWELRFRSWRDG